MEEPRKLNRREQAKARTRQAVLDAAKALFDEVGYEAATIRAIAKRMKMSTGAVFANFEDKAEVYRAIYGHLPLSPEEGRRLFEVAQGFALNRAWISLSPQAHEGAKGALERLLDLAEDLTNELSPKEVQP